MKHGMLSALTALGLVAVGVAAGMAVSRTGSGDAPPIAVTAEEMKYVRLPYAPPELLSSVPVGDLGKKGVYVLRNRFPPHFTMKSHRHEEWRVMTVLEGTLSFAYGDAAGGPRTFGPGSVIVEPPGVWHRFNTGREGALVQFVAEGPLTSQFEQQDPPAFQ